MYAKYVNVNRRDFKSSFIEKTFNGQGSNRELSHDQRNALPTRRSRLNRLPFVFTNLIKWGQIVIIMFIFEIVRLG